MDQPEDTAGAPVHSIVPLPLVDCQGKHSFGTLDLQDGRLVRCKRCGEVIEVVRLERAGDSLRLADPEKHGIAKRQN